MGNMTDFDKLTLEVWTDGTISARDAVSLGAKILCDHFTLFTDLSEVMGSELHCGGDARRRPQDKVLELTIEELDLSRPQLQLPQARQHQHRRGSDLQDRGGHDEGP